MRRVALVRKPSAKEQSFRASRFVAIADVRVEYTFESCLHCYPFRCRYRDTPSYLCPSLPCLPCRTPQHTTFTSHPTSPGSPHQLHNVHFSWSTFHSTPASCISSIYFRLSVVFPMAGSKMYSLRVGEGKVTAPTNPRLSSPKSRKKARKGKDAMKDRVLKT